MKLIPLRYYKTAKVLPVGPSGFALLLFLFPLLNPSELVAAFLMEFATLDPAFAMEFAAPLTAVIELLMAEVTAFVAVEAEGSSIAGIWGMDPDMRKELPTMKI